METVHKRRAALSALVILFTACLGVSGCDSDGGSADAGSESEAQIIADTVFQNVNVIPMTGQGVLEDHWIFVTDGDISDVVPSETVAIGGDPTVIDGAGGYLIPGLSDIHVHFNFTTDAVLYIANGVTLVRNMWGDVSHLTLKQQYASGEKLGPELWTTGPIMDGDPPYWEGSEVVTTAEQAHESVLEQIAAGYDGIKVYSGLSVETFDGIMETTNENDFPVWGHVPTAVGIVYAAEAGLGSNEHLMEYNIGFDLSEQIAATVENGMWNCPTLVVTENYSRLDEIRENGIDGLEYAHPWLVSYWEQAVQWNLNMKPFLEATMELYEAGAPLLLGTDVSNPYVIAGFSVHEELRLLVQAGLTPHQALIVATRNAAEFLNILEYLGTVEKGKDADLVLLRQNPLEDISRTKDRAGVMVDGVWYSEATLNQMLEELLDSYPSKSIESLPSVFPVPLLSDRKPDFKIEGQNGTLATQDCHE